MTVRRRAAAALLALLVTSACGIRPEDEPRALDTGSDAYGILVRDQRPGSTGTFRATVYLVRESQLARIIRQVTVRPTPPVVLRALLAGPTASEQARGLSSALGITPEAGTVYVAGSVLLVELPGEGSRNDAVLGYGQVVCTLTELPGVSAVAFVRGGEELPVPRGDGSLVAGPLTCADYSELVAR